jgi:hypothetical protein
MEIVAFILTLIISGAAMYALPFWTACIVSVIAMIVVPLVVVEIAYWGKP